MEYLVGFARTKAHEYADFWQHDKSAPPVAVVSEAPDAPSGCRSRSRTTVCRKGSDASLAPGPFDGRGPGGPVDYDDRYPAAARPLTTTTTASRPPVRPPSQGPTAGQTRPRVNGHARDQPTPQPTAHSLDQPWPSHRPSPSPRQPTRVRRSNRARPEGAVHTSPGFQPWVQGLPPPDSTL